ncbi:MAG: TetR/AcrR family transcriptional regulator [Thermincola sp.]|jgi:AcrR family transcriptional regulator|nr:TetR/AcrR family transcriptional regulator [Thermincola sp.]MDT3702987.1 TetR/AcrR family transcriptional regulator [Thermincola sp.]
MNNAKTSNRKAKALETKKNIYKSAEQLFQNHGFDNVSVDTIVEMAGVSKGAFYVHFGSKDYLIAALIADYVEKVDLDYKSFLESIGPDLKASDKLILLAGKIADITNCTIGYDNMKFLYAAQLTRTINTDAVSGYNREIYQMLREIISTGQQQGEFKTEISPDIISKHCILALRGLIYEWCIRYPDFDLKDQVLQHFEILLTGITK